MKTSEPSPKTYGNHLLLSNISANAHIAKYTRVIWTTKQEFHKHDFWEISFVVRGNAIQHFPHAAKDLTIGSLYILRPNDVHYVEPIQKPKFKSSNITAEELASTPYLHRDIYVSDEKMKSICASFGKDVYDNLLTQLDPPNLILPIAHIEHLESTINFYSMQNQNFDFMHTVIVTHILCYLLENSPSKQIYPNWLNTLLQNLRNESFMTMKTKDIFDTTHYNHSYICRQFKKYLKMTFSDYLKQVKCNYSCSLLSHGNISGAEIAYRLNFTDQNAYIQAFKSIYGITPGKYRKLLIENSPK